MKTTRTTRKRMLSMLLSLAMCISLIQGIGMTAYATDLPVFSGGAGTQADPWKISTVSDFKALAVAVNGGEDYTGKYFKQTANLDMDGVEGLVPVGTITAPFAGNYNGSGFTISDAKVDGVTTDGNTVAGIFGVLTGKGSIAKLVVTNATITSTVGSGAWNMAFAGGLVAVVEDGTVSDCVVSNSNITANGSNADTFAGAFVGYAQAEDGEETVFNKCASENNTVKGTGYAGGFAGSIANEDNKGTLTFTDCYSAKNTASVVARTGGTVAGNASIGAFLGASQGGDLIIENCFVYDCIASAEGSTFGKAGLFSSDEQYGEVSATNCYYYDTHNLTVNANSAVAKTAEEMKSLASLLGEVFSDGDLYPVIKVEPEVTGDPSATFETKEATANNAVGFAATVKELTNASEITGAGFVFANVDGAYDDPSKVNSDADFKTEECPVNNAPKVGEAFTYEFKNLTQYSKCGLKAIPYIITDKGVAWGEFFGSIIDIIR
ncbi:MAG: hypothetical protein IJT23_10175 [Clostridia bacterium]|nr:hypothetical protein [Clostridia bacterium]